MLIFRGGNWPEHRPWFLATLLLSLAAGLWFAFESIQVGRLAGGGSLPGFVFGVIGGLIILFEMLLWVRKRFRAVRIGRAKLWLKAHLWLGVFCVPLLILHSGFRWFGGSLGTALMVVLFVVILSGIWGATLQHILPKLMLENVPAETIYSQIDEIRAQFVEEATRLVRITCGQEDTEVRGDLRQDTDIPTAFVVVGAVRATGPIQGRLVQTRAQSQRIPGSEPLLAFFETTVSPYLRAEKSAGLSLASSKRSKLMFDDVRTEIDPAAHDVVNVLEDFCDQRRQFDLQARIHVWLHAWLWVHLPLSVGLTLLMFAHIFFALKYF
jgi:hypothetical protein